MKKILSHLNQISDIKIEMKNSFFDMLESFTVLTAIVVTFSTSIQAQSIVSEFARFIIRLWEVSDVIKNITMIIYLFISILNPFNSIFTAQ